VPCATNTLGPWSNQAMPTCFAAECEGRALTVSSPASVSTDVLPMEHQCCLIVVRDPVVQNLSASLLLSSFLTANIGFAEQLP
jgi:hypothetical protein